MIEFTLNSHSYRTNDTSSNVQMQRNGVWHRCFDVEVLRAAQRATWLARREIAARFERPVDGAESA